MILQGHAKAPLFTVGHDLLQRLMPVQSDLPPLTAEPRLLNLAEQVRWPRELAAEVCKDRR